MLPKQVDKFKVNILIVDDKPANICSMEAILADADYNLVSASSGAEALRCILQDDFAVILLDVMMPEMDGFEVARLIRQRNSRGIIPIIFLTAIATEFRYMQAAYAVGAVDYLQKPLDPDMVRAKVAVFVELYRRNEMIRQQEERLRELQRIEQERRVQDLRRESERHFQKLAESMPQIIYTFDAEGTLTFVNGRWRQFTGFEARGTEFEDQAIHPDDRAHLRKMRGDALHRIQTAEAEVRLRDHKSRLYRWHLWQLLPELSLQNELAGWLGTFTDIDNQKRREKSQRILAEVSTLLASPHASPSNVQQLADHLTSDLGDFCCIDLHMPNGSFQRIMAHVSSLQSLARVFPRPRTLEEAATLGAPALKKGRAELSRDLDETSSSFDPLLAQLYTQLGLLPTSLVSAPIKIRGELRGALSLFRFLNSDPFTESELDILQEIGNRLVLHLESRLIFEEVRENNRLKDEFLALLSHELRTPLNSILGWTELIKMETKESRVLDGLEVIDRSAKSLTQLVNDLLDVSRIITGKLEITKQTIEASGSVRTLLAALQPYAVARGVRLECQEPLPQARIHADPSRLEQILWNLLTNAIKFTAQGGLVQLAAQIVDDKLELRITDTGIGIRPEHLPFIFDRFRQADSSITRRHGGLGLGLAIVKHLTELHQGEISAWSAGLGQGSIFTLTLPLLAATAPSITRYHAPQSESLEDVLIGLEVLLVDDDPSTRMLAAKQLSLGGARVILASSVAEALKCLESGSCPDIILTDIGMPDQDGFALLRRLRQMESQGSKSWRVAAFSAYASEDHAKSALAAGFDSYLTKPISAPHLIHAVLNLSQQSRRPYLPMQDQGSI